MPYVEDISLELKYPYDHSKKCDIVLSHNGYEIWIEVKGYFKTESASTRSKKHNSTKSSPTEACTRLSGFGNDKSKIIIIYQNIKFNPKSPNSWHDLKEICNINKVKLYHVFIEQKSSPYLGRYY